MTTGSFDVLVVGAGPAGSTAAGLLAKAGHRVLVLEKEQFPRFHIGESLLPGGLPVLERLGVATTSDIFVYKSGAEFVCEASGRRGVFEFRESLPGCARHAWHVERSRFDKALCDRATVLGADVRHGVTVVDAGATPEHAFLETRDETFTGRYLIDASGQSRLLARRHGTAQPYQRFGNSAVFTHYEGLGDAAIQELDPASNNIRVMLRSDGWGWIIPLPERRLSVGIVSKGKITPEELERGLLAGPLVQRLTVGTRRLETRIIGNYSYRNTAPSGPRYAAIGDAACFLDPVFSSGVTLALRAGEAVADRLSAALLEGREAAPDLLTEHDAAMDRAFRTFAGLIDRFYNSNFAEAVFLGESFDRQMRSGVLSVLAGDVWRTGNPFQEMLLSARRPSRGRKAEQDVGQHDEG